MDFETLATTEVTAFVARLAQAATGAREQALNALRESHAEEVRALAAEHTAAFEQINATLLKAKAEHDAALQAARTEHESALQKTQADCDTRLQQAASAQEARFADAESTHRNALAALAATHDTALQELKTRHDAAVNELTTSHEAIVQELNDAQQQMGEHARRQLSVVTDENHRLMDELTALERKHAELASAPAAVAPDTRGPLLAHLSASAAAIARSFTQAEVFAGVAQGLTYDFSRVVVFQISDQRLEAVHKHGFGDKVTLDRLSVARQDKSLLAKALQTPNARRYGAGEGQAPAFAGTPATMLTAPIIVRGEAIALIYADDGGAEATGPAEDCTTLAAMLQEQAALRLDRLAIEQKAVDELRAYATMLLDETEYVYNADVSAGKTDSDRITQLQENVRCARQIFMQRVTVEGPAAASVLDDVVADRLRMQAGSSFAQDLGNLLLQGDLESNAA